MILLNPILINITPLTLLLISNINILVNIKALPLPLLLDQIYMDISLSTTNIENIVFKLSVLIIIILVPSIIKFITLLIVIVTTYKVFIAIEIELVAVLIRNK